MSSSGEESGTPTVVCPFCESDDVERESAFGSEISKAQYYCHGCNTIFERIRYDGNQPDSGR
ncbi:PaaD-like zinc ribbon domain-containing protein [Natrialbaceae archaeon A-gly3]